MKIRFSKANCKSIAKKNLLKLHNLDRHLIHFIDRFWQLHAVKDFILIYILEHLIHNIESDNCGPFHLYFYEKLFSAIAESQIFEQNEHDQSAFEQYFSLDFDNNERVIGEYIEKKEIKFSWIICHCCPRPNNLSLVKTVDFGQRLKGFKKSKNYCKIFSK